MVYWLPWTLDSAFRDIVNGLELWMGLEGDGGGITKRRPYRVHL